MVEQGERLAEALSKVLEPDTAFHALAPEMGIGLFVGDSILMHQGDDRANDVAPAASTPIVLLDLGFETGEPGVVVHREEQ